EHRATLLHYVSANGVENYRQQTPQNIVRMTELLLAAGAEVDAEANVYGGGCTTLGLVATSAHPRQAGVQNALIQLLLDHGARMEHPNLAGNDHGAVFACLANGCPEAARYLADRGARLDLVAAAGVGRLDVVQSLVDQAEVSAREMALRRVAAAGQVPARHPPVNETVDAALARHGSVADPAQYWWGEAPRAR